MKNRFFNKFFLVNVASLNFFFAKISKEQVQLLYKQLSYFIILSESLVATGLCIALWSTSNHILLISWLLYMYLISGIGRVFLLSAYQKNKKNFYNFWLNLFFLGVFCSGIGWGFVSFFLLPSKEIIQQTITIIILFGIVTTASHLYSPVVIIYTIFLILSFVPLTVWFFLQGDLYTLLGLLSLFYLGVILNTGYYSQILLLTSLAQNDKIQANSKELRDSLAVTKAILESTDDGILVVDSDTKIKFYNQKFLEIWDFSQDFIKNHTHDEAVIKAITLLENPEYFIKRLNYISQHPDSDSFDELNFVNGKKFERYSKPHKLDNKIIGRVWTFREITERKKMEEKIIFQATHDTLTGLPNRAQLNKKFNQKIKYAKRFNVYLAILFIDLDNFKNINDNLGHEAGDILLCHVAKKLVVSLRETDTVFRFAGDEFIIFCLLQKAEEINNIVTNLRQCLSSPINLGLDNIIITVSMGISIYPKHGKELSSLLKKADMAMYWAKKQGRNSYVIYRKELSRYSKRRLAILSQLHLALKEQQFYLLYQPIVDLKSDSICSFEVLLRWYHPIMGYIQPTEFIPIAEENGLIIAIGEWVLQEACKQAKIWQGKGFNSIKVAVNVSGIQISRTNFASRLEQILKNIDLKPECLIIELTESTLMSNQQAISIILEQLRRIGIKISIDDFGTGYSSFAYLKDFSIDKIKIDKTFIQDCPTSPNCVSIIKAIIAIGKNLNSSIVAEGVETIEQLQVLRQLDCGEIQGFLFSQPLPSEDIPQIININLSTVLDKKGYLGSTELN